jgi:hypothetical protein
MSVAPAFSSFSNEESNQAAWEATLDRLEQDVLMAERFLASGQAPTTEPWEVPQLDGPMPDGLLPRASEILRRQAEVKDSLRVALTANDKQRAFADRVNLSSSQGSARPAYVDFTA